MKRIVMFGVMFFLMALLGGCANPAVTDPTAPGLEGGLQTQVVACQARSYTGPTKGALSKIQPGPTMAANSIACPLGQCLIVDFFGARKGTDGSEAKMHYGVDLRAGLRSPVKAVADGYIESWGDHVGTGNYGIAIVVRHKDKSATMYAHLDPSSLTKPFNLKSFTLFQTTSSKSKYYKYNPAKPINVKKGQVIGYSGNTYGHAPHLHLEYILPNKGLHSINVGRIDPVPCLESLEPAIKVTSTKPLKMTKDVGQETTGTVMLQNTTTDEIILDGLTVNNGPTLSIKSKENWIAPPPAGGVRDKPVLVGGKCSTAGTFNGTVSTTLYKGLNDGKHTKGWAIPTKLVAPNGILPKPSDMAVVLTCKAVEQKYKVTQTYTYTSQYSRTVSDSDRCNQDQPANGTYKSTSSRILKMTEITTHIGTIVNGQLELGAALETSGIATETSEGSYSSPTRSGSFSDKASMPYSATYGYFIGPFTTTGQDFFCGEDVSSPPNSGERGYRMVYSTTSPHGDFKRTGDELNGSITDTVSCIDDYWNTACSDKEVLTWNIVPQ